MFIKSGWWINKLHWIKLFFLPLGQYCRKGGCCHVSICPTAPSSHEVCVKYNWQNIFQILMKSAFCLNVILLFVVNHILILINNSFFFFEQVSIIWHGTIWKISIALILHLLFDRCYRKLVCWNVICSHSRWCHDMETFLCITGACIPTMILHCHKPPNQWQHSFQMKAALPLANRVSTASDWSSNIGPWPFLSLMGSP